MYHHIIIYLRFQELGGGNEDQENTVGKPSYSSRTFPPKATSTGGHIRRSSTCMQPPGNIYVDQATFGSCWANETSDMPCYTRATCDLRYDDGRKTRNIAQRNFLHVSVFWIGRIACNKASDTCFSKILKAVGCTIMRPVDRGSQRHCRVYIAKFEPKSQ